MLVAIGIFVILATLTVGAFRSSGPDRISAATGTFKNALEGARSRAIKSGEVRGLRLIQDSIDTRIATSLVYVGAPEFDTGTGSLVHSGGVWVFGNNDTSTWETLQSGGFLNVGNRIEIPANTGNWYTITAFSPNVNMAGQDAVTLAGHYQPSTHNGTSFVAVPSSNLAFRMELSPTVLSGSEPIVLPPDTCIDLDGSVVPWRDSSGDYTVVANHEILFSPQGVVTGNLATQGVVMFRVASVSDLTLATQDGNGRMTTGTGAAVVADPEKGHKAVGIFTQTGSVVIAEFNTVDGSNSGFNNDFAPSTTGAYRFILLGKEGQ